MLELASLKSNMHKFGWLEFTQQNNQDFNLFIWVEQR